MCHLESQTVLEGHIVSFECIPQWLPIASGWKGARIPTMLQLNHVTLCIVGVLVVNVTWKGKTYMGTLLDATKHDWSPPRYGNCSIRRCVGTRPAKIQLFSKDLFDSKLCNTSIFSIRFCFLFKKYQSTAHQLWLKKYIKGDCLYYRI